MPDEHAMYVLETVVSVNEPQNASKLDAWKGKIASLYALANAFTTFFSPWIVKHQRAI